MSESKPAPDLTDLAAPDAEVASARIVFRELDKSCRATRTYGLSNAITRRFFDSLQTQMLSHLEQWASLAVIVDRTELRLYGEVVYRGEDSLGESLAFRLYADGVREVRFEEGLDGEDLQGFLDALWGRAEEDEDDDVVTRLWAKDLATISFVTAEDIMQAPWAEELAPQEHGFFAAPPASFEGVLEREKKLAAVAATASMTGPAAAGENLTPGAAGLVGFEVSEEERRVLTIDLTQERAVDSSRSVLSMLEAILQSETAPDLLTRGLAAAPAILDALLAAGNWSACARALSILEEAPGANPSCEMTHRLLAQRVLQSLNLPERVALIGTGLATEAGRSMSGLSGVFARLGPPAVGPLCGVLAGLTDEEQRAALRDTLIRLGADNPEPALKGLADPRPRYVRDLVTVIVAWQQPQAADVLAMLAHHPEAEVREDALSSIARLHPTGDAAQVVAFVSDADREVRLHALRLLASARYTGTWEQWKAHLADPEKVIELPRAEKRMLFQAVRATAGEGAVPFWLEFLSGRGWKQRQKKEETALLAIKALVSLATPVAREALEFGRKEGSGAVRKACAAALDGWEKA
ncbi:MAG: HEAT repeat domain-containing protein [Myxococcales bacterium]